MMIMTTTMMMIMMFISICCSGILDSSNMTTHQPDVDSIHSLVIGWAVGTTGIIQRVMNLMAGDWT